MAGKDLRKKFDLSGERYFENGVDWGVLFVKKDAPTPGTGAGEYEKGIVWNGLTNVSLSPEGAEPNDIYADNIKYLSLLSVETLKATIEAYQSPVEFDKCDGTDEVVTGSGVTLGQQARRQFALLFRTKVGNDVNPELGYKYHIIYGCLASPSERAYETINDSPEAMTLSWEVSTTPVAVEGFKPTALVTIDMTKATATGMATKIEGILDTLYGKDGATSTEDKEPTLLLPDEIYALLTANSGGNVAQG